MTQRTLAIPRILVIEDKSVIRRKLLRFLVIPEDKMQQSGICKLKIEEADSVSKTKRLLDSSCPYDLVLLDLRLPDDKEDDGTESLDNGHNLLHFIKESQTAKGVLVVSDRRDYENVRASFRGGALDYIAKPITDEQSFQSVVLNALERLMAEESNHILNQRIRDLVAYAEIGLAHSFKNVFSRLLQEVTEAADGIEKYARERFGLDKEKDPYDSLILKLRAHKKAVTQARQNWAGLQAELARGDKALNNDFVGKTLRSLKENLLSCLVVKYVTLDPPDFDEKPVLSFEKDVEVVLREIIVGALSELPDYGKERHIKISFTTRDTRAEVRFEDDLDPIPEEKMDTINQGQRIIPDAKFGRAWGLSVAQLVALRGGGELKVKTERGRNIVTYYIPLADYA
jgi:response regulator of citrate/malate metabolism